MTDKPQTYVNTRAELRAILQRAGLARAAADTIAKAGLTALSEETHTSDEKDLEMSIQDLRERARRTAITDCP